MDWKRAISRNRDTLREIVAALFVVARMRIGGSLFTLPRATLAAVMLVLRPAESAVRRLIVLAAHGLVPSTSPRRAEVPGCAGRRGAFPIRAFKLFDPLKSFDPEAIWDAQPVYESWYGEGAVIAAPAAAPDDKPVNAAAIGQRLNALMRALDDLPRQARRLARWQMKRDALLKAHRPTRISPMRPGLPPGWRERPCHEIDLVLRECHGLANDLLNAPDTG